MNAADVLPWETIATEDGPFMVTLVHLMPKIVTVYGPDGFITMGRNEPITILETRWKR